MLDATFLVKLPRARNMTGTGCACIVTERDGNLPSPKERTWGNSNGVITFGLRGWRGSSGMKKGREWERLGRTSRVGRWSNQAAATSAEGSWVPHERREQAPQHRLDEKEQPAGAEKKRRGLLDRSQQGGLAGALVASSRVYEGATFVGGVAQGTSEHALEPKEGSNLRERCKILQTDVTRDTRLGSRQAGPPLRVQGLRSMCRQRLRIAEKDSTHEPKILQGGTAGDRYAFWKMIDSDNVMKVNLHMGGTTDAFPLDARDLERNRTTWYSWDSGENWRCLPSGFLFDVGSHGVNADQPPRVEAGTRRAPREQITVPNPPPEALWSLLGSGTEQAKTFYRRSFSGVKTTTPAVNTVTALDQVELNPLASRAKGDMKFNAESAEFRALRKEVEEIKASQVAVQAERAESPDNVNGEAVDKSGTGTDGAAHCRWGNQAAATSAGGSWVPHERREQAPQHCLCEKKQAAGAEKKRRGLLDRGQQGDLEGAQVRQQVQDVVHPARATLKGQGVERVLRYWGGPLEVHHPWGSWVTARW